MAPPSEAPMAGHVLLVSFPGQGHINPLLRLGKRLASTGLLVTFSTVLSFGKQMKEANGLTTDQPTPVGRGYLRFEFFDDMLTDDDPRRADTTVYFPQLELYGKEAVFRMVKSHQKEGRPISCLINNPFVPWVCDVASELNLPCAVLWVQSCSVFSTYYYYDRKLVPFPSETEPDLDVEIPCLPLLKHDEIPSFLHPSTTYSAFRDLILCQFKNIDKPFCVLIDTFYELESEIINHMSKFNKIRPIGPLFKNPEASSTAIKGDMMRADDCIEWLDSKPPKSVVYISFGTVVYISQEQVDEIAYGLMSSGLCFLWVMKPPLKGLGMKDHELPEGFWERVGERGKVVKWSPQEQVLAHPSLACFLSHCGWNSTMEALASGVPVIAFPQWGDQVTDAKFLVEVLGVGLRLCRGMSENRLVKRDEVEKCLAEATKGPKADEMKERALKWKKMAQEAVAEGGSSDRNIQELVEEIRKRCNADEYKCNLSSD